MGTPENTWVTSHFRPLVGPREGRGEVATFNFVPFDGDPRERRGYVVGMGEPLLGAQCARSATIWASGRTRDPYFEILGPPRGIMVTPSVDFDF